MITPEQIEEWIRELEDRPHSGAKLIRSIGNRLRELDAWNQELLADNIALRSEHRVEEYEQRIASLEYQLETPQAPAFGSGSCHSLGVHRRREPSYPLLLFVRQGPQIPYSLQPLGWHAAVPSSRAHSAWRRAPRYAHLLSARRDPLRL